MRICLESVFSSWKFHNCPKQCRECPVQEQHPKDATTKRMRQCSTHSTTLISFVRRSSHSKRGQVVPVYASNASSGCIGVTHGATHYGRFWKILSQNWGMNFCFYDFIFILFLNILASKAQKNYESCTKFWIFWNWNKIAPALAKFQAWVLGQESSKLTIVHSNKT